MPRHNPLAPFARLRAQYTGEPYTAALHRLQRALPGTPLVPDAAPAQQRLERLVLLALSRPNAMEPKPLGILHTVPGRDSLTLHLDSSRIERISNIAAQLLPWKDLADPDGEIHGVAGLRASDWHDRAVRLTMPGMAGEVVLTGMTPKTWRAALALRTQGFDDPSLTRTRQFWRTDPHAVTAEEHAFNARWKDPSGEAGRSWLASGLLRRMPLFAAAGVPVHTEAWSYPHHPRRPGEEWVMEVLCGWSPRGHRESVELLTAPGTGLPMEVVGVDCACGEAPVRSCTVALAGTGQRRGRLQLLFNPRKYKTMAAHAEAMARAPRRPGARSNTA